MNNTVEKRRSHSHSRWLAGALTLTFALMASCFGGGSKAETLIAEFVRGQVVVTASGTLEASRSVRIAPQVSGKVTEILVSDGEHVETDQLLFKLDPAPYQKAADEARGRASSARAAVAALGISGSASGGGMAAGANTRAVIESGKAVTPPVIEVTPPASVTVVSPAMPSAALLAAQEEDARALVSQVQGAMTAEFKRRVTPLVAGALAQATAADVEAEKAEEAVDETEVRASMPGVVSFLPLPSAADAASGGGGERLSVGRVISAGQPVVAIYDLAEPVARAKVPESEIARIKLDQPGIVKLTAFAGKQISAKVSRVSLEAGRSELGAIAYQVDLKLAEGDLPGWRPGMSASVEIIVEEIEKVVEVPAAAVFTRGTDDYVYVVDDGTARAVKVETARGAAGKLLIRTGLKPGDKVVVSRIEKISEGSRV
ncbi:MAG: hypothetical protein DCC49_05575 [Acidobacteria bacterium]|nr:MAG: hypothetical protein DCC49_05575 [Acidobacteriota bacterium]